MMGIFKSRKTIFLLGFFIAAAIGLFIVNQKTNFIAEATCYECTQEVYDAFCWRGYEGGSGLCPHTRTTTYGTSNCASRGCTTYFCDCTPNGCCGGSPCNGSCDSKVCSENIVADSNCRPADPSCTVTWSTVPSTIKPNTNFTATITQGTSNVGWNNPMTYKDGVAVPGGTAVSGGYTWVINSGSAASHELRFAVDSPDAGSAGPITYCTPPQSFSTINPPTASIDGPLAVKAGEPTTNYTASANGTNLGWVRMYYALKSTIDAGTTSPNPWTRIGDATQNDYCNGSSSCTATAPNTFTSPGQYYVAVNANQVDGAGNAMPCTGNPQRPLASGWTDCGPSDLLTVDVSDVEVELKIEAAVSTSFVGAPRTSGKLSTQGGVGFVNPMKITLSASSASGVQVKDYYVALHAGSQLASETDFVNTANSATLQSGINSDPQNGFLLWYATQGTSSTGDDKFYVWDRQGNQARWIDVTNVDVSTGYDVDCKSGSNCTGSDRVLFTVRPDKQNSNSGKATWRVDISKNFTSKSLWTPIYAIDTGGRKAFSSDFIKESNKTETGSYAGTLHFR